MTKEKINLEDGRYLIYFRFTADAPAEDNGDKATCGKCEATVGCVDGGKE